MQDASKKICPGMSRRAVQYVSHPTWRWVSERGLRVATGDQTLALYAALMSQKHLEIEDIIPADDSLLLVLRRGAAVSRALYDALAHPITSAAAHLMVGARHEIEVEYGGSAGLDLPALAERAGMDLAGYIGSHASVEYTVAFLGFQPGFPYFRGLPEALHAPRRASPRVSVPAGSVAIGGAYCGIYPAGGPGGWQIIGRAVAVLFDPRRDGPALLRPGDHVRFIPR